MFNHSIIRNKISDFYNNELLFITLIVDFIKNR